MSGKARALQVIGRALFASDGHITSMLDFTNVIVRIKDEPLEGGSSLRILFTVKPEAVAAIKEDEYVPWALEVLTGKKSQGY